jgi:hypothetical protein
MTLITKHIQAIALALAISTGVYGHVEDICIAPPGDSAKSGVYNFYSQAVKLGCDYAQVTDGCVEAVTSDGSQTFGDTSICRCGKASHVKSLASIY